MKNILAAIALTAASLALSPVAMAQGPVAAAGTGNCATSGMLGTEYNYPDLPNNRFYIVPSLSKQMALIGSVALRNGCKLKVSCVAPTNPSPEQLKFRDDQCWAVRQVVLRTERRPGVQARWAKEVSMYKAVFPDRYLKAGVTQIYIYQ